MRKLALSVAVAWIASVPVAGAATLFAIETEPDGARYEVTPETGSIELYESGPNSLLFLAAPERDSYLIVFTIDAASVISRGVYPIHRQDYFGNQISVGAPFSCPDPEGQITVLEAERTPDGTLIHFAAEFELQCVLGYGQIVEAVRGILYHDATGPPFPPLPDLDSDGVLDTIDRCIDIPDPDQADVDEDGLGDACDPYEDVTSFSFESEPGHWIGRGFDRILIPPDPRYGQPSASPLFSFGLEDANGTYWEVTLEPRFGTSIQVGHFESLGERPIGDHPGFALHGGDRSCDGPATIDVLQVERDVALRMKRFAADFVHHCAGKAFAGSIRLHASPEFGVVPDRDGDGAPDVADTCPDTADPGQSDADLDGIGDACEPPAPARFVRLDAEPGTWVGDGKHYFYSDANAELTLKTNFAGGVTVLVDGKGAHQPRGSLWRLDFVGRGTPPLGGAYEDVVAYPFQQVDEAAFSIGGLGRGCGDQGRFDVLEFDADPAGRVRRFAADFEQRCDPGGPVLRGSVRFESAFHAAASDRDGDGVHDTDDSCPDAPDPTQLDADADGSGDACTQPCDDDGNGVVDRRDVSAVVAGLDQSASSPFDPRDADADGAITVLDVRACVAQCRIGGCEETSLVVPEASSTTAGAAASLVLAAFRAAASRVTRRSRASARPVP